MTNTNQNIESLVVEFNALTTQNIMNTYRKGEIVSAVLTAVNGSLREAGEVLGVSKVQASHLLNTYDFANEVPMIDPVQVISSVGTHNIRWLSAKSRQDMKEEIQVMVNDEEPIGAIQSRIEEMKEASKPVKSVEEEVDVKALQEELDWYKKALHDTMIANEAATELVGKLLDELEETDCRDIATPVVDEQAISETGKELVEKVQDVMIPQEIVDEVLKEGEEDMQLEFQEVEVESEPAITKAQYEQAKALKSLGIAGEVELAIVDEYERDNQIGKYRPSTSDLRARLAKLRTPIEEEVNIPSTTQRKMYIGYETDDEAFSSEWA